MKFMTDLTSRQWLKIAKAKLKQAGIQQYSLDAELILRHVTFCDNLEQMLLRDNTILEPKQIETCESLLARRVSLEPISHIIGKKHFWEDIFIVNEHVLAPRPESELLIELVLEHKKEKNTKLHILDLGTGSGCLVLTLLKLYKNAYGIGVDISSDALLVAEQNASHLNLSTRVSFIESDWFNELNNMQRQFEIIVANPPYVSLADWQNNLSKEVKLYEPKIALTDNNDGLDYYRVIASKLPFFLSEDGIAVFEFGYNQAEQVRSILEENNLKIIKIARDLAGIKRAALVTL